MDGFSPFLSFIDGGSWPLYFSPVNKQTCNFGVGVGERGSMVTRREMFSLRSLIALAQAPHTERITTSRRTHAWGHVQWRSAFNQSDIGMCRYVCALNQLGKTYRFGKHYFWNSQKCTQKSEGETKPSIIWLCHSFISYAILQLILRPAFYLLIYLTSLYFLVVTATHKSAKTGA